MNAGRSGMCGVLVTGGFGFIGSHLVERLLPDPNTRVHVVDNMSSSPIDVDAFVRQLAGRERLTYDICGLEDYSTRVSDRHFDEIYHLAAVVGPVGVLPHAGKIAGMMVNDTARIIALGLAHGAKVVDVSTSEVYGGGRGGYCSERGFQGIQPKGTARLADAVGQLAAEIAPIKSTKKTPFPAGIRRPFNGRRPRPSGKG